MKTFYQLVDPCPSRDEKDEYSMTDVTTGKRFSQLYLRAPILLQDSARMRNRLALYIGSFGDELSRFGSRIQQEQGILIGAVHYAHYWPDIISRMDIRDVLDSITTIHDAMIGHPPDVQKERQAKFLAQCRRIFSEEQVGYHIDDSGGVHFAVDQEFEHGRTSAIAALDGARYNGVRSLHEDAFNALDRIPPDGKSAVRASFFATESLFRLMFSNAHQLSSSEVQKHLEPLVNQIYAGQKPAVNLAQKLVSSLRDWIDGAHFYRHEPGDEDPAQPPIELAIYMVSEASGHLRWLAKLDALARAATKS